ncbi:MAG: RNA polymerase sigma factor [Bacteroidetes bacterium]|nr:RNA polymerase sigma factor [Bacteroidota bacterium]
MTTTDFHYKLVNLQGGLTRLARSLTSDREDAKDLVQETFLKALKYKDKFAPGTNFKAWTFTILKNTYINCYHRTVRQTNYSDQTREHPYMNPVYASGLEDPDSLYGSKEIEKLVESLEDDFKLPFKMYQQGFKYREIAEALNLNLGTLKSRMYISRQKLMKKLNS